MSRTRGAVASIAALAMLIGTAISPMGAAASPANDDRAEAAPLSFPGADRRDAAGATTERGEPMPCETVPDGTLWYRFDAPPAGAVFVTAAGTDAPAGLAVYDAADPERALACWRYDVAGPPRLDVPTLPGRSYVVQLGVYGSAIAAGVSVSPSAVTTAITGTVRSEGGAPLPGACVRADHAPVATLAARSVGTTTADDGTYRLLVQSGVWTVGFRDCEQGIHVAEWYQGRSSAGEADPVVVSPPSGAGGIDATLARAGGIDGRVTDTGGAPIPGACVRAEEQGDPWAFQETVTDAAGAYRLAGLRPGDHLVQFWDCTHNRFTSEWYDNAFSIADADPVLVVEGGTVGGIDATLVETGIGVPRPVPDAFADAAPAPVPGRTFVLSTAEATLEPGEPQPCHDIGATVWHRLDGVGGDVRIDADGSELDAVVAVHRGTSLPSLETLACAPGADGVHLAAVAGETYWIQAGGAGGATGTLALRVTACDPAADADRDGSGDCDDVSFGVRRVVSGDAQIPAGCGDPGFHPDTEVEPYVAVNPSDDRNVIGVWQQDRYASHGGARTNGVAWSRDGGVTWSRGVLPGVSTCTGGAWTRATDPWVSIGPNGTAYAVSLSMNEPVSSSLYTRNALVVNRSFDGGETWTQPSVVVEDQALLLNDKESITADPTDPRFVYIVWLKFPGTSFLSRSIDGGASWLPAVPLWPLAQGNIIRVLPGGTLVNVFSGPGGVQAARSTDRGLTWGPPVHIGSAGGAAPSMPGGQVRSGASLPTFDVAPDGTLYVAWQDVRGTFGGAILFAASHDGGRTWSAPRAAVEGAWQSFTPGIAVAGDGTVGVAYYDARNVDWEAGAGYTDVRFAWSRDGGRTWQDRHAAGPFDHDLAPFASGLFLGDYAGLAAGDETFHVFYPMAPLSGEDAGADIVSVAVRPA